MADHKQLQDLREQLYNWQQLEKAPGWLLVLEYAKAQIDHRFNDIVRGQAFEPADLNRREYQRGECAGIDLFQHMATIEIERLKEDITVLAQQVENEENLDVLPNQTDSAP